MLKNILLVASLLGLTGNAWALPYLTGDVAFGVAPGATWTATGGTPTLTDPNGVGTATGIQFNGSPFLRGFDAFITDGSGSFANKIFTPVDFHDFTFNPLGSGQPTLWSFVSGTVNYALRMTGASVISQNANQINLAGGAILSADGYQDTVGSFQFTANNSGTSFSYSASAQVPEPTSIVLFGVGLLGMGFSKIRRRESVS